MRKQRDPQQPGRSRLGRAAHVMTQGDGRNPPGISHGRQPAPGVGEVRAQGTRSWLTGSALNGVHRSP